MTELENLIDCKKHQLLLLSSPNPVPLNFIYHTWIVTNNIGEINRWEVWQFPYKCKTSWGHVHLNLFKPFEGMRVLPYGGTRRFPSSLLGKVEDKEIAQKMINFLYEKAPFYENSDKYRYFPGPNSNTFVQWILNRFPESNLILPNRAIGKDYKLIKR